MKNARARWFHFVLFDLQRLLLINLIFLFVGFLWRLAFMFSYGNLTELRGLFTDTLYAYLLGLRFDGTILFYVNSIPLLLWFTLGLFSFIPALEVLLESCFKNFRNFLVPYLFVMLLTVNFIAAIDYGYYGFYQDRINILIFGFFEDDTWALVKTLWKNYPIIWIFTAIGAFAWLLWMALSHLFSPAGQKKFLSGKVPFHTLSYPVWAAFLFGLFLLNGVGARGSLGLFPLSEMDTGISKSAFINHLGFNSARAFTRAIELKVQQKSSWDSNLKYYGYAEDPDQAFADFFKIPRQDVPTDVLSLLDTTTAKNPAAEKTRPHVILLVMESWGGYWMRYQQPGFDLVGPMRKHLAEDNYLKNFLSGASGTIGSLSSLMAGVPQRPIGEFLTESEYLQVNFRTSLAKNFKNAGYKTEFVYGGNPGWREVNKFALKQDFDVVSGEHEISESLGTISEKHDWGIYDEDLFKHIWKSLEKATRPQLILGMTTTNHPPYQLPAKYQQPTLTPPEELRTRLLVDAKLAQQRFQTYRYSMDELAHFMTQLKNSPLKDKVIVAVTGDHTFWLVDFPETQALDRGSVPFYLYVPAALSKGKLPPERFGSHLDIPATLYSLALSERKVSQLGQDLFGQGPHLAMNAFNFSANESGGVLTGKSSLEDHYFDWQGDFDSLTPANFPEGTIPPERLEMARRYRALMGLLDYYFVREKNENTRR